jgi:hypothetical protein
VPDTRFKKDTNLSLEKEGIDPQIKAVLMNY